MYIFSLYRGYNLRIKNLLYLGIGQKEQHPNWNCGALMSGQTTDLVFTINHGTNFIIQSHGFHFLSQNLMENVEVNKRIVFTGLDLFRFHRIGSDKADRCLIILEFCNHIECSRNLDQWVHQLWCIRLQREVKEHFLQDTFLYWIKSVNNGD